MEGRSYWGRCRGSWRVRRSPYVGSGRGSRAIEAGVCYIFELGPSKRIFRDSNPDLRLCYHYTKHPREHC
jgi:hypothetical protein